MSLGSEGRTLRKTGAPPDSGPFTGQFGNASNPDTQPPAKWWTVGTCLLLALAVWVVFGQTLRHEFVNLDDTLYVTDNAQVASGLTWGGVGWAFKNFEAGFWHPLTWLSLMTDAQLYGLRAGGYHLSNAGLHMVSTLVLFILLRRLTQAHWQSAFVAALFALHPLHVESVAWVSARKDVLSTLFWMLTLLFYARYVEIRTESGKQKAESTSPTSRHLPSTSFYLLALGCFAGGLMSKTMVVTLPVVMLLLDYWPLRRYETSIGNFHFKTIRSLIWEKSPFFGLALIGGLLTIHAEKRVGALATTENMPIHLRAANAALSSVHYLWQTVWPTNLAAFYPYPSSCSTGLVLGSLLLLALISLTVIWVRNRHPYLAVGWFWFVLTLLPVSGLIQVGGHARADRYTYVPLIGIFLMMVWGLAALCASGRYRGASLRIAAATMLAGLMLVAHAQTAHWRDSVSLWSHTLACTSRNPVAHNSLGYAYAERGRLNKAIQHYYLALQLNPDYSEAHNNLGISLAAQGRRNEAVQHYERALQLKPDNLSAHNNLGIALAKQGKFREAIQHYARAIQLKPDFAEAHNNLGSALQSEERFAEAIQHYTRAIRLKPDYANAHNNLGSALTSQGRLNEAIQHCELAIGLKPNYVNAHVNLGNALAAQGRSDQAIQHFQTALNLATAQANPALAAAVRKRLESYQPASPQPKTP